MNIYLVTGVLNIHSGLLLLNNDQANRRNHVLVKQSTKVPSLKLSDEEQQFLKEGDDNPLAVYKLIGSTQFKIGEKIGYDGELNKATSTMLTLVVEVVDQQESQEQEPVVDEALVNAIVELDPENPAHFANNGKPEIKVLAGLLDRKVSGKERDDAFKVFNQRQDEIITAIGALEKENDDHWDEDNVPNLSVVSEMIGYSISQAECELAYQAVLKNSDESNS